MSSIWFSSDLHLGHKRILEFCRKTRRGATVEEHDELLVDSWNSVVDKGDTVYILGDECLGNRDVGYKNISRLNGEKHLILGNHSYPRRDWHKALFKSISDIKKISVKLEGGKQQIIMCHFPIISWENMHHGSWMLYGHEHGGMVDFGGKMLDVGIDNRPDDRMLPFSLGEVEEFMSSRAISKWGHH